MTLTFVPERTSYVTLLDVMCPKSMAACFEGSCGHTKTLAVFSSFDITWRCRKPFLSTPPGPRSHNSFVPPLFVLTLKGNSSALSKAHVLNANPICFILFRQLILSAVAFDFIKAGSKAARMNDNIAILHGQVPHVFDSQVKPIGHRHPNSCGIRAQMDAAQAPGIGLFECLDLPTCREFEI